MITKKCAVSLITCVISLLLIFAAVHFMSLFSVSKWVGIGIGGGVLVVALVLYFVFRKKSRRLPYYMIAIASLATGVTTSSLFVLRGAYPPIWQTAVLYACLVAGFYLYCLCTNLSFCRNHYKIALVFYAVALLGLAIVLYVLRKAEIYILAMMSLIPFVAFLISLSLDANDKKDHIKNLTYCAFGYLFIAVIVVLIILSEGEALDGFDVGGGAGAVTVKQHNPYEYLKVVEKQI